MKRSVRKKWVLFTSIFICSHVLFFHVYAANYLDRLLYEACLWQKPVGTIPTSNKPADIATVSLFKQYPVLANKLHYLSLGNLPTPLKKCTKLGASIGVPNFYIKDDGQINSSFGGNHVRKLEFLLADARANSAKTVISTIDVKAYSVLALTLCAQQLNMKTIAILSGDENSESIRNNLRATAYYGAEIHYHPSALFQDTAALNLFLEFERRNSYYPYIMPAGLSNELSAIAYVNAAFELKDQISQGLMPEPDYIFVPVGTMSTAAGLILGLAAAGLKSKVVCARVDVRAEEQALYFLIQATQKLLTSLDPTFIASVCQSSVKINGDFYKDTDVLSKQVAQDIALLQTSESIVLDPLYSGKAFSTCLSQINKNKLQNNTILFWNTYSQLDYSRILQLVTYKKLPASLQGFFV
ncbi:MAG: pyridoxal-phosphate dependent enzyme [bacterium]